jgi:hypothetical protein
MCALLQNDIFAFKPKLNLLVLRLLLDFFVRYSHHSFDD